MDTALAAPAVLANAPDNPFSRHGIEHLSASTLNALRDDPAYGLLRVIPSLRVSDPSSPAGPRGRGVEKALTFAAYHPAAPDDVILGHAHRVFQDALTSDAVPADHEDLAKEADTLPKYVAAGLPEVRRWGPPSGDQGRVDLRFSGIEVPLIGYYDLKYPDRQRELKSTNRMPSSISYRHGRQVAIYEAALRTEVWVSYASPRDFRSFRLEGAPALIADVAQQVAALRRFLGLSRDAMELAALLSPNFDHWCWGPVSRQRGREIWGF